MKSWHRAALVLLASLLPAAPAAHAQQAVRVGSFLVLPEADSATREDRSRALIAPTHGRGGGMVMWQCVAGGGVTVGVSFGEVSSDGESRRVVWRFDEDRPDTASLSGMSGDMLWYLPADRVAPFILRARSARRLVVRGPADAGGTPRPEHAYDLAEPGAALDRLSCARGTPVAGRPERRVPVRTVPPDEGTYALAAVEELPRMRNVPEVSRMVQSSYPAALRGSGITGRVQLRFRLLENGRVDPATVQVTESTHEAFNEPAIAAVRRIVMAPAMVNGRPVRVWVEMPLTFAADAAAPAAAPPAP